MSKIRVYELAKELNVSSKELIELLMTEFNVEVKNHMSVIEDEDAALIKELLGEPNKDEASKEVSADNAENTILEIGETITVKELADSLQKPYADVIKNLMFLGVMAAVNQEIDFETAAKLCDKYEILYEKKEVSSELESLEVDAEDDENLVNSNGSR